MSSSSKKKKKVGVSKRQLNKAKRAQSKIKAKASERRRKRLARTNINIPRRYKFKHISKRVNNNGGAIRWHQMPNTHKSIHYGASFLISLDRMNRGEFRLKTMVRLGTRLRRRMEAIKSILNKKKLIRWDEHKKGYRRKIRAYVSYSERALGLRLGKGKGKLGGWRIPIKPNQILYSVENFSAHGNDNPITHTLKRLGRRLKLSGSQVQDR